VDFLAQDYLARDRASQAKTATISKHAPHPSASERSSAHSPGPRNGLTTAPGWPEPFSFRNFVCCVTLSPLLAGGSAPLLTYTCGGTSGGRHGESRFRRST
jgi:hypothetical protein